MAVTVTEVGTQGPGKGRTGPAFFTGARTAKMALFTVLFDNSYPTGGEDVSEIFTRFKQVHAIIPFPLASRIAVPDVTNKKLLLYTALGTQAANASDQSTITATVLVIGEH